MILLYSGQPREWGNLGRRKKGVTCDVFISDCLVSVCNIINFAQNLGFRLHFLFIARSEADRSHGFPTVTISCSRASLGDEISHCVRNLSRNSFFSKSIGSKLVVPGGNSGFDVEEFHNQRIVGVNFRLFFWLICLLFPPFFPFVLNILAKKIAKNLLFVFSLVSCESTSLFFLFFPASTNAAAQKITKNNLMLPET